MIFNSISQYRSTTILILAVFSVVIVLFSGYHSMNIMGGNGTTHQADAYSCLFTFCVAIFTIPMLFAVFIFTSAISEPVPSTGSHILFLLEKPPRG